MRIQRAIAFTVVGSILAFPISLSAQQDSESTESRKAAQHDRAEREQTDAKVVGGTAAGGAVLGAVAGGGKGALIGGAAGAGAGAVANKVRKDKAVKKREQRDNPQ